MADLLGIDRRTDKENPSYQAIKMGNMIECLELMEINLQGLKSC
jgi:hypothetical protein